MIQIVWEFIVKEEARGQFELAHGPGGAWSTLFARHAGFRGITMLRDTKNPLRYLMLEVWDTEEQREQVLSERKADYADLVAALGGWTESKTVLGSFSLRAEAAVRPRGKAGRRGRRSTR